jgi:hypothetical protein
MKRGGDHYDGRERSVYPGGTTPGAAMAPDYARRRFPFSRQAFIPRAAILIFFIVSLMTLVGCPSPLFMAAVRGDSQEVTKLLEEGADVNLRDTGIKDDSTPLHGAAIEGQIATARILIANRADVNAKNNSGATPLHWAIEGGHAEMVRLLVEAGSDPLAVDARGQTPLQWAQRKGRTDIERILIEAEKGQPKSFVKTEVPSTPAMSQPTVEKVPPKDLPKIAVWDLMPREVKSTYAQELTSILVSEITQFKKYEVYSQENVRTLAGWTEERMKLGCTSTQCLTALGQMDISKLISGSVGKIGNRYSISLNLFDTEKAKAENAVSEFGSSEDELIELMQRAIKKLIPSGN